MNIKRTKGDPATTRFFITTFALLLCANSGAAELVLDWDQLTWTPEGNSNLTETYQVGHGNVTVEVSGATDELDNAGNPISPSINAQNTGGLMPVENSLYIATDYSTNEDNSIVITFDFSDYQGGVSDVQFSIFDIDALSSFIDQVTLVAVANSVLIDPTDLNGGSANQVTGSNTVVGTGPSNADLGDGNVDVFFGQSGITEVQIIFSNEIDLSNPGFQWMGIHDVSFTATPVPLPGALLLILSALVGLVKRPFGGSDRD